MCSYATQASQRSRDGGLWGKPMPNFNLRMSSTVRSIDFFSKHSPPRPARGAVAGDPEHDFHQAMMLKVARARKFLEDPVRRSAALQLCFVAEPLDWLWQRIQHLDEASSPLWDLRGEATSPFAGALKMWADIMTSSVATSLLGRCSEACPEIEALPTRDAEAAEGPGRERGGSCRPCPEAEPERNAEAAEGHARRQGGSVRACPEAEPLRIVEAEGAEGEGQAVSQADPLLMAEAARDVASVRKTCLSMVAQVYWRLVVQYEDWPYPLAASTDPSCSGEDVRKVAERLWSENLCCLDEPCSRKVRMLFPSAEEMLRDEDFMEMLRLWGRRGRLCNMHVERILSLVRKSVSEAVPNLERLCGAGFLAQTLREHRQAGGRHPSATSRRDLQRVAVPIRARARKPTRMVSERGGICFSCKRVARELPFCQVVAYLPRHALKHGEKQCARGALSKLKRAGSGTEWRDGKQSRLCAGRPRRAETATMQIVCGGLAVPPPLCVPKQLSPSCGRYWRGKSWVAYQATRSSSATPSGTRPWLSTMVRSMRTRFSPAQPLATNDTKAFAAAETNPYTRC